MAGGSKDLVKRKMKLLLRLLFICILKCFLFCKSLFASLSRVSTDLEILKLSGNFGQPGKIRLKSGYFIWVREKLYRFYRSLYVLLLL